MIRPREQRPIEFRQVCAIARVVLLARPTMNDAEWKGATLDACSKQGWAYPEGDMLARAMGAVERALEQTIGKRHVDDLAPSQEPPRPDNTWTPHDLKALAETVKRIQARSAGATPTNIRTIPQEHWEVSEPAALDEFYRQAEVDRLVALKRFAEIAIARPADWDYAAVRAQAAARTVVTHTGACYACRNPSREMVSHHVIQIQHGGSNYLRNRVDLCTACHAAVHPWLPKPADVERSGWSRIGAVAESAREAILKLRQGRRSKEAS